MTICDLPLVVFDGVIDVSHHNGAIDWPAVSGAGIALAFIKATQGTRFVDPRFQRNRSDAERAGVLVVPYHFLETAYPDRQAEHFLAVADLARGEPGMIDWETPSPARSVVAFGTALADCTGRDPIAYYGYSQLSEADPMLSAWPLTLPAYPRGNQRGDYASLVSRPPRLPPGRPAAWDRGQRPYHFHQYTPAGAIHGVAGPVDRSIWVGTAAELGAWYPTGALPAHELPAVPAV